MRFLGKTLNKFKDVFLLFYFIWTISRTDVCYSLKNKSYNAYINWLKIMQ